MKIKSIQIKNYRSIEDLTLSISKLSDRSTTFGLIGVNEAGKSSILKALALKESLVELTSKDFRGNRPIEIIYILNPSEKEIEHFIKVANDDPVLLLNGISFTEIICTLSIVKQDSTTRTFRIDIDSQKNELVSALEERLKFQIVGLIPSAIFWTAETKYLIDKPINRAQFAVSPEEISVPLKNCFSLAGIFNIQEYLGQISETTDEEELENLLGEKVTDHIRLVWPNHPVQITFRIAEGFINFHVKDDGVNVKAKTVDQRSDGFKQFVSFLLTISAQNKNEELSNTILLLDEPETHLHPQAQEYLLNELTKITRNDKNNLCFFATHSLFMIDKNDLSRHFKILKSSDITQIESFQDRKSSYSRVSYEVYGIPTSDLHNELYGMLQARQNTYSINEFDNYLHTKNLPKILYVKEYTDRTENKQVTMPTKIRNIIHHPENRHNSYTIEELKQSIDSMLRL